MKNITLLLILLLNGCISWRLDPYHVLIRSDVVTSAEKEKEILAKARVGSTDDGRIQVLYVSGTPYERGYQHGALLRNQVQDNLGYLYKNMIKTFRSEEIFAEVFERMRPFIPEEYLEEMHGLAHGSKLPLHMIHYIHALPELSEWGGKKKLKDIAKRMVLGEDFGTSCSNFSVPLNAGNKPELLTVRVLDWGLHRISKLHEYPLIIVDQPDNGIVSANVSWVGFIGAVSGMNAAGITLGEMGYGDTENETLRGKPMIFLLREILSHARSLADVRKIIRESPGTNSYGYLMSDGKTNQAEMYIRDPDRFLVFQPGTEIQDTRADKPQHIPAIKNVVYGGHFTDKLFESLSLHALNADPEKFKKEVIPYVAMHSNFQNVVYLPARLQMWVSYAGDSKSRAAEQTYSLFQLEPQDLP